MRYLIYRQLYFSVNISILVALFLLTSFTQSYAEETATEKVTKRLRRILFKAPKRGAPAVRMGAGIRGGGQDLEIELTVLTPLEMGLTIHDQPFLFWYQSKPSKFPLVITVNKGFENILEHKFNKPSNAGIQRLNLADHNIRLETGVKYEWTIILVPDADQRAKDITSISAIKRIEPDQDLVDSIENAAAELHPFIYAEHGIWYDAFAAVSRRIDENPKDLEQKRIRSELLRQVGLENAAHYDAP